MAYYSNNSSFYKEDDFQGNPDYAHPVGMPKQEKPMTGMGLASLANPQSVSLTEPQPVSLNNSGSYTAIQNEPAPKTTGLYDYWKQPVVGNMPLSRFVQLAGMMSHAIAPDSASGRIGAGLAQMGGQAEQGMLGYEEREQERADINQKYQEQAKEKRFDQFIDYAGKSKNKTLQKVAYDKIRERYEQDFGKPLPEWNDDTPDLMAQLREFRAAGPQLGLSQEEMRRGEAEILFGAGELPGKEYLAASYPEKEGPKNTDDIKEYEYAKAGGFTGSFTEWINAKRAASGTRININNKVGEGSMTKLGEKMSEQLVSERPDVVGAVAGLETIKEAKKLLNSGMITGAGAEYMVSFGNFLSSRLGITYAKDPVANSQAYAAMMGSQVGQIIKQFGSGTGLSDADREYAEKIAGGKISLSEPALRKIISINEKAYNNVVKNFNKRADQAMTRPGASGLPYDLRVPQGGESAINVHPNLMNYIQQNSGKYSQKAMYDSMRRSGWKHNEIIEAWRVFNGR